MFNIKKMMIFIAALIMCVTVYAGFEGLNGGTSLKIFNRINCSTGMTCSRGANGLMNLVSDPSQLGSITLGTGLAADVSIIYDGNAQNYNMSLDDSTDDLVFGLGNSPGVTDAMRIDEFQDVTFVQDILPLSTITGDGGAALSGMLQLKVVASASTLSIVQCGSTIVYGAAFIMTLPEASTAIGCRYTFVINAVANGTINPFDGTDQIVLLTDAAGDAIEANAIGESIVLEAVSDDVWAPIGAEKGTWADVN